MKKTAYPLLFVLAALFTFKAGAASAMNEEYSQAVAEAKAGDRIFAFMHFREVAARESGSRYREKALFAIGEYYFSVRARGGAFKAFSELLSRYPESKMKPFALFYLYKMARDSEESGAAENFRKEILNWERVILIFKKSKEHKLKSPMGIKYKLIHYVDRLEFYIDGKLREKILY
ncbi:MAG: hypothetical protein WC329_05260 [Candidatus Omnitrophota bacterium]|jgi:outer membrane protein assembly factor BamD (BamD/ComL family)